jgi:CDP-diacylglycerol--serine O-phosphatidyltransferase
MRGLRRIRTIAILPTMFTLANLVCGFFSIVVAARIEAPTSREVPTSERIVDRDTPGVLLSFDKTDPNHNIILSVLLIFLAMLFDALDGHLARLARTTTNFGAELDSLADLVTFGVAPAFLLVKMCPTFTYLHGEAVWVIAASFAACAAMRLARFNVESDEEDDHLHFSGLPTPAAAASIASFAIMFYTLRRADNPLLYAREIDSVLQTILPFFALLVSLLMVSRIPYPHVVNQILSGHRSFAHLVKLVFALVIIMIAPGYSIPIVCVVFVLGGPLRYLWQVVIRRETSEEPIF